MFILNNLNIKNKYLIMDNNLFDLYLKYFKYKSNKLLSIIKYLFLINNENSLIFLNNLYLKNLFLNYSILELEEELNENEFFEKININFYINKIYLDSLIKYYLIKESKYINYIRFKFLSFYYNKKININFYIINIFRFFNFNFKKLKLIKYNKFKENIYLKNLKLNEEYFFNDFYLFNFEINENLLQNLDNEIFKLDFLNSDINNIINDIDFQKLLTKDITFKSLIYFLINLTNFDENYFIKMGLDDYELNLYFSTEYYKILIDSYNPDVELDVEFYSLKDIYLNTPINYFLMKDYNILKVDANSTILKYKNFINTLKKYNKNRFIYYNKFIDTLNILKLNCLNQTSNILNYFDISLYSIYFIEYLYNIKSYLNNLILFFYILKYKKIKLNYSNNFYIYDYNYIQNIFFMKNLLLNLKNIESTILNLLLNYLNLNFFYIKNLNLNNLNLNLNYFLYNLKYFINTFDKFIFLKTHFLESLNFFPLKDNLNKDILSKEHLYLNINYIIEFIIFKNNEILDIDNNNKYNTFYNYEFLDYLFLNYNSIEFEYLYISDLNYNYFLENNNELELENNDYSFIMNNLVENSEEFYYYTFLK
jgi:hypothetical protein